MIQLCRFHVAPRLELAATIAVTTATLVLATSAPAYAQAARIDNISPAAARSGETVAINGAGFGALNVRVAVGGFAADLLAANGNRVTFRVPDGVPPGATLVTATNPGGRTGTIAFRVLEGILLSGNPNTLVINATFDLPPVGVNETQNVPRNAAQPSSGAGNVVIVACNANVHVAAGAIDREILIFGSESSTIDVAAASSGSVIVGLPFGTPNHAVRVSVTAGASLGSSVTSCLEYTVAINGAQQSLTVNSNQDLSLHTGDVLGNVTITQNSMPRGLAPIVIGDVAGNLTITNNRGVSNTDARAFAEGRTVVGTVTISGNTP